VIKNFPVDAAFAGLRVDVFLREATKSGVSPSLILSRSYAACLLKNSSVRVGGTVVDKDYIVKTGNVVEVFFPEPEITEMSPENIPLEIVFEDDFLMVIEKPKGMVVHPAPGNRSKTLVNSLLFHRKNELSGINGKMRPGIIHRLDKNTSGLLVVAKNDLSHRRLAELIKNHDFEREYEAVVCGKLMKNSGIINKKIGRNPKYRKKMTVTEKNSKEAITHYEVIRQFERFAHIRLRLETGRTHQIRVHMAHIGNPVLGDEVYGRKSEFEFLIGQCLHAKKIAFVHPVNGKFLSYKSNLPPYFVKILEIIRNEEKQ
jgi:23S rRNA pseudouridine1911/1915/1917 synthase